MKNARHRCISIVTALLLAGIFLAQATDAWAQDAAAAGAPKKVNKIYIVGYTLVALMVGLGVLVICHYRERKARPDLPQDVVAERLRQGVKAPPAQKSG